MSERKYQIPLLILFVAVGLALGSCSKKNRIAGYRVSEFPSLCREEPKPYTGLTTIADPHELFQVKMPYMWDIQELYNDSVYGIIGANLEDAAADIRLLESFSVNGYRSPDSLTAYFIKEIEELKKSTQIRIQSLGTMEFAARDARWVLFETEEKTGVFYNMVIYVKKDNRDEIFLLQSTVYKTDDFMDRLCRIKTLFDTFKFLE